MRSKCPSACSSSSRGVPRNPVGEDANDGHCCAPESWLLRCARRHRESNRIDVPTFQNDYMAGCAVGFIDIPGKLAGGGGPLPAQRRDMGKKTSFRDLKHFAIHAAWGSCHGKPWKGTASSPAFCRSSQRNSPSHVHKITYTRARGNINVAVTPTFTLATSRGA
jgi:hypothetical protein